MARTSAAALIALFACLPASAQWSPSTGQWGRTDARDFRFMTFNVRDTVCSTNTKTEGNNNWTALARIVAAMKPDVLVMQECADNSGNGTGTTIDTQANLNTTINLFLNGGTDPFKSNTAVTAYVKKYDPNLSYPYYYSADVNDGFNRNVIISKYPFKDLNGDGKSITTIYSNLPDAYAPGGGPGIRGFILAEIDLPDCSYRGDVVISTMHLKSGSTTSDYADRLTAAKNNAYYYDYLLNGAGTGVPDPHNKISDNPPVPRILDAYTPLIWGGDFNEDENTNGRDGPAMWMTHADSTIANDGTDRDRTDSTYDDARDPNSTSSTNRQTISGAKFDYVCWQDSIATLRRAFIYNAATGGAAATPPELVGFPVGLASSYASDHKPVIADFILPAPPAIGAFSLSDPSGDVASGPIDLNWSAASGATAYAVTVDSHPDFSSPVLNVSGLTATTYTVPAGTLTDCTTYYWKVTASNACSSAQPSPASLSFRPLGAADFNGDGFVDFYDFTDFVNCFEGNDCPPNRTADVNGDDFVDFYDFTDFVDRFETGC